MIYTQCASQEPHEEHEWRLPNDVLRHCPGILPDFVPSKEIQRWGDKQQYFSEPMPEDGKKVRVTLINATPDPLGTIAAMCGIYKGNVIRDLRRITDEQRREIFFDMTKTVLNGPLEAANFVFLIEGVSRDFTHQAVRHRNSFFAQESLRFAVKEDPASEIPLPPYLSKTKGDQTLGAEDSELEYMRNIWDYAINTACETYVRLVDMGMPAEEARKLLPHGTTTRYWWAVNLRGLLGEAGKRTCTQAQFDWRIVMGEIARALREYGGKLGGWQSKTAWQYNFIADQIRPVCYQEGKCGFMAEFDRGCSIRERVDAFAFNNIPSSQWHIPGQLEPEGSALLPIYPYEWAADPGAART